MNIGIKSPFFNSEIVCKWAIRSSPRVCPYRWGKTTHGHQFQSEVVLVHERNDQQGAWGSSCLSRNWIWMTHDGSWWFMMVHESKVIDRPSLWVVLTHNDTYVTHCYPNPVVMVSCEPCCEMSFVAKILPQQRQSATSGRVFPMRTGLCWQVGLSLHTGETGSDAFQPLGTVWEIVQVLDAGEVFFCPWTCLPFCWELSIDPHILNDIEWYWYHFCLTTLFSLMYGMYKLHDRPAIVYICLL